jgi:hypothetical protein
LNTHPTKKIRKKELLMSETESNKKLTTSEYVNEKYAKWEEKYIIRENMKFLIKSMFQLEYQFMMTPPEHTKAKKDILDMIYRINQSMMLKEKNDVNKPMYIDWIRTEGKENIKVLIYIENKLIILDSNKYHQPLGMKDYAKMIYNIAIAKKSEIYINVQGFGISIYDYLMEFKDLKVNKLDISKSY